MILYQSLDFDLIPSDLLVPKILPGVFGYAGDCHYSIVRREGDLSLENLWIITGTQETMAAQTVMNAQNMLVSQIREIITLLMVKVLSPCGMS